MANPQPVPQPSHRGAAVPSNLPGAVSPPSKTELKSWWRRIGGRKNEQEEEQAIIAPGPGIFGVPLADSIRYANVAISFADEDAGGRSKLYGYVPIVVAKCGVFLKEKATDVEGIFRLNGSAKRIKDLQTAFDSPDKFGKGLDWTGYTVHDAANILRRYLNQLPEPIVPLDFYERFREPLRTYQATAGNGKKAQAMELQEHARVVGAYKQLITELPALNRQLLLYILDLLAVFASKSDVNLMNAQNLAAIFQPGILSHPQHHMAPNEYLLSQDVLIFLIENQDNFLFGMAGTAMDEAAQNAMRSGPPSVNATAAKVNTNTLGRSASNASAGADSLRRLRRGVSTSSRNSRQRSSPGVSTPGTPGSPAPFADGQRTVSGGVTRSNTLPPNHSPALTGHRLLQRTQDGREAPVADQTPTIPGSPPDERVPRPPQAGVAETFAQTSDHPQDIRPSPDMPTNLVDEAPLRLQTLQSGRPAQDTISVTPVSAKPATRERKISNLFPKSPIFGPSDAQLAVGGQQRQQRKLQKRRIPISANESAHSSQASFQAADDATHQMPLLTPNNVQHELANPFDRQVLGSTGVAVGSPADNSAQGQYVSPSAPLNRGLMSPTSPAPSTHSKGSFTDPSDLDALDDHPGGRGERQQNRFRLSALGQSDAPLAPPPVLGQLPGARTSGSSLGSAKARKSYTGDSQQMQGGESIFTAQSATTVGLTSSKESADLLRDQSGEPRKEGFLTKWKAKLTQSKDEREAEKRAKSPPRLQPGESGSRQSLSAFAHEHFSPRGRSMDRNREESLPGGGKDRVYKTQRDGSASLVPNPMPLPIYTQTSPSGPAPTSTPVSNVAIAQNATYTNSGVNNLPQGSMMHEPSSAIAQSTIVPLTANINDTRIVSSPANEIIYHDSQMPIPASFVNVTQAQPNLGSTTVVDAPSGSSTIHTRPQPVGVNGPHATDMSDTSRADPREHDEQKEGVVL